MFACVSAQWKLLLLFLEEINQTHHVHYFNCILAATSSAGKIRDETRNRSSSSGNKLFWLLNPKNQSLKFSLYRSRIQEREIQTREIGGKKAANINQSVGPLVTVAIWVATIITSHQLLITLLLLLKLRPQPQEHSIWSLYRAYYATWSLYLGTDY